MSRRAGATIALLSGTLGLVLAAYTVVINFPRGGLVFVFLGLALVVVWIALLRRGLLRSLGLVAAAALLAAAAYVVLSGSNAVAWLLVAALGAATLAGARAAFRAEHSLPLAPAPKRPVLFVNP